MLAQGRDRTWTGMGGREEAGTGFRISTAAKSQPWSVLRAFAFNAATQKLTH